MKIGIWGCGVVGGSLAILMEQKFKVNRYDKYNKWTSEAHKRACANSDVVFFCVPTPMINSTGRCFMGMIEEALKDYQRFKGKNVQNIPVIKSTVPIGSTRYLSNKFSMPIYFNPEFLVEKTALKDTLNQKRVILGGQKGTGIETLRRLYKKLLPKALQILMSEDEAEAVKYFNNVALAGQVAIFNEIHEVLTSCGVNYNKIRAIALMDKRIGRNALISMDGKKGFGGKCFPKDLRAFIHTGRKMGYISYVLEEIWRTNLERRGSYE